jgi:hypothetical protein
MMFFKSWCGKHATILAWLLLLVGSPLLLNAQQTEFPASQPRLIGKLSLFSFLNINYPAIQIGVEHPLTPLVSLHHQVGYLLSPSGLGIVRLPEMERYFGFQVRTGGRLYTKPYAPNQFNRNWLELHVVYQLSDADITGDFCRFGCNFRQRIVYNRRREFYIFSLDAGALGYYSNRWMIEAAGGYQWRFSKDRFSDIPEDATLITNGSNLSEWQSVRPGEDNLSNRFTMRFLVGYILK